MILCAVDDSAAAERVVDTGRWLTGRIQTPLVVVHVSEDPDGADEVVGRVRARLNGGDADVRVLPGSPAEAIREAVDEHDPELVVSRFARSRTAAVDAHGERLAGSRLHLAVSGGGRAIG